MRKDNFAAYDGGSEYNLRHYNSTEAPTYSLAKFPSSVPLYLFSGGNDNLADPTDVSRMASELPVNSFGHLVVDTYNHMDFVWGMNAYSKVYPTVVKFIQRNTH